MDDIVQYTYVSKKNFTEIIVEYITLQFAQGFLFLFLLFFNVLFLKL